MTAMLTLGKPGRRYEPIRIDAPFYQAGLAGYSDAAMRVVARRHGCPYLSRCCHDFPFVHRSLLKVINRTIVT